MSLLCVDGDPGRRPAEEEPLRSTSRLLLLLLLFDDPLEPPFVDNADAEALVVVVVDAAVVVDVNLLIEKLLLMCRGDGEAGLDTVDTGGGCDEGEGATRGRGGKGPPAIGDKYGLCRLA